MQSVQNVAVRLLTSARRCDHITPLLRQLHWLPVQRRVEFKTACLVHQSLASLAPTYLTTDIYLVSEYGRRPLRSSTDRTLTVPWTHNRFGDRSFAVAGPRLWNSLPISLRQISSYGQFRRYLKNHLFEIWEITAQCDAWFSALYKYSYLLTTRCLSGLSLFSFWGTSSPRGVITSSWIFWWARRHVPSTSEGFGYMPRLGQIVYVLLQVSQSRFWRASVRQTWHRILSIALHKKSGGIRPIAVGTNSLQVQMCQYPRSSTVGIYVLPTPALSGNSRRPRSCHSLSPSLSSNTGYRPYNG